MKYIIFTIFAFIYINGSSQKTSVDTTYKHVVSNSGNLWYRIIDTKTVVIDTTYTTGNITENLTKTQSTRDSVYLGILPIWTGINLNPKMFWEGGFQPVVYNYQEDFYFWFIRKNCTKYWFDKQKNEIKSVVVKENIVAWSAHVLEFLVLSIILGGVYYCIGFIKTGKLIFLYFTISILLIGFVMADFIIIATNSSFYVLINVENLIFVMIWMFIIIKHYKKNIFRKSKR